MSAGRVLLLVGSARPRGESTSEALGRHLLRQLEAGGMESDVRYVSHCRSEEALASLAAAVDAADIFLLATPVYVDSLPYLVTLALERIAGAREAGPEPRPVRFLAIANCGFPEAVHTEVPLAICRAFARRAALQCAGTLGLGGGEALRGRAPDRMGWLARHVTRSLDLAAEALLAGRPVPEKAVELMARPLVPAVGYTLIADLGWRRQARAHGVEPQIEARPYRQAESGDRAIT
jgi:hypothetical protein